MFCAAPLISWQPLSTFFFVSDDKIGNFHTEKHEHLHHFHGTYMIYSWEKRKEKLFQDLDEYYSLPNA